MKIEHLAYFFSILIFGGAAILHSWKIRKKMLKKYEIIILFMVAISIPFTAVDYFALKWGGVVI